LRRSSVPLVVACSGTFAKDSDHLKLATAFDSKNVTFTDVEASDGNKVPASVLFANDPKRRLEVWWSNPAGRSDIHLIVISGQSTWTAPGSMRLGQTLDQVEKLNHKPFKLKGFDKDHIAIVTDWDGGALATLAGGCNPGLSLRADPKASASPISALSADKEYSQRAKEEAGRATKEAEQAKADAKAAREAKAEAERKVADAEAAQTAAEERQRASESAARNEPGRSTWLPSWLRSWFGSWFKHKPSNP
jgi:hypothetical protein